MKCKVCGSESGKYPLCHSCNAKRETGEIIKCKICGNWHYSSITCPTNITADKNNVYLYETKNVLISKSEQEFFNAIKNSVPESFLVFPQINLATIIVKTDGSRFHNELFRNVDFLITDNEYHPKLIIEINDTTHLNNDRKERDEKVRKICEEAGLPIINLWTSYGINQPYIKKKITEAIEKQPIQRVHHFSESTNQAVFVEQAPKRPKELEDLISVYTKKPNVTTTKNKGCYIATCVYGSYDCSPVWVLRRYRDNVLSQSYWGNLFVKLYYSISPTLVKWFGQKTWFKKYCKKLLDLKVSSLQSKGFKDTPYNDS